VSAGFESAGIAIGGSAAVSERVVGCNLHERLVAVVVDELVTDGHRVLVVVAARPERVLVEVLAGDVGGCGGRGDQDDVVLQRQALQAGSSAGTDRTDDDVGTVDFNQLTSDCRRQFRIGLVVLEDDIDLTSVDVVGLFESLTDLAARRVGETNRNASVDVGAVDGERTRQVGDDTDRDWLVAHHCVHVVCHGGLGGRLGSRRVCRDRCFRGCCGRVGFGRRRVFSIAAGGEDESHDDQQCRNSPGGSVHLMFPPVLSMCA
jgi:hypothetical protein